MTGPQWEQDLIAGWMRGDPVSVAHPANMAQCRLKYGMALRIQPKSIVEIGVRGGYTAFAMLSAVPDATYIGIDNDSGAHGGHPGALDHARGLLSRFPHAEIRVADSQHMDALPPCDLLHVDGDHSYDGCMHDMALGLACAKWIAVDDYKFLRDVRRAVHDFAERHGLRMEVLRDGYRDTALIQVAE